MLGASQRRIGRDWRSLYVSWKPKGGRQGDEGAIVHETQAAVDHVGSNSCGSRNYSVNSKGKKKGGAYSKQKWYYLSSGRKLRKRGVCSDKRRDH